MVHGFYHYINGTSSALLKAVDLDSARYTMSQHQDGSMVYRSLSLDTSRIMTTSSENRTKNRKIRVYKRIS